MLGMTFLVAGSLTCQRRFRGLRLVGRGIGTAPQPAEQVDLPARRRPDSVLPLVAIIAGETVRDGAERAPQALTLGCGRCVEIDRRQQLRTRCRGRRARLLDASERRRARSRFWSSARLTTVASIGSLKPVHQRSSWGAGVTVFRAFTASRLWNGANSVLGTI
jgi:hypothetical protein